ncbi:low copy number virion structural protein (plasmid) [Paenibacillus rhizovicinus]|uniref:Low copy number virion structural protein n=1 Tax=Paenibacillus rhizovicinus TaxID=2704463 RepID=A0A6C0PAT5_9BACL|nr:low copy number virion structural protein [Paenibacillus rhizovicinus]QHW35638.1 low copy number virion structural protein [Paenibacillus rhizovicinus]
MDIILTSEKGATFKKNIVAEWQQHPVIVDDPMYEAYRPTPFQYEIESKAASQAITIAFDYANRLTETEAKYAVICLHQAGKWTKMATTVDATQKQLICRINVSGTIAIFMNEYWYSDKTQETTGDEFPLWTFIRQSKESNAQRFMNYLAMQIEVAEDDIDDIKSQKFIPLLNTRMIDWVFIYELPIINAEDTAVFRSAGIVIPLLPDLKSFFFNKLGEGAIVDYTKRRMYSQFKYNPLEIVINGSSITATPIPHQIWNPFDEFGLLTGVERLHQEKNVDYKERILDAFRYPANSSDLGLTHALGRELNLIKRITWNNDLKNLVIKGKGIDERTLRLDGRPLQLNTYTVDADGTIIIQAVNQGNKHVVSFIQGIKKHELHDQEDEELHLLMYQQDGQATATLENWVAYINQVAPIMWGKFNWDEGFWDTIDASLTGLGYLPNMWDSDIEVWKNYMFEPKSPVFS